MSIALRPEQAEIAAYRGGLLAVSAVPGSGKTHTLAALAVNLIAEALPPDGEVLVVTFTNSAVDNIRARIRRFLKARALPDGGYRVFTLHGLANAILRERPDLAGLTHDYRVDDELSGRQAMPDAARGFIVEHQSYWESFLPTTLNERQRQQAREGWQETTERLGYEVTRLAKNLKLTPADLKALIAGRKVSEFLKIGAAIYERYDRILSAGGRLDFDDLIWGAIRALRNDDAFRRRLGQRWAFILEDEAQDSTPLQEEILALLSRDHGNWVRVGDPNQAIMTTFTASDVRLFRAFRRRPDVRSLKLTVSGRSALPIIQLANALVEWAVNEHPERRVREEALSAEALIRPTDPGDPQQNPPADQAHIWVHGFDDVGKEVAAIAQSAARYVQRHPQRTCAVLAPTNQYGQEVVAKLTELQAQVERPIFQDQLRNAQPVRDVARALGVALAFCAQPTQGQRLAKLYEVLAELGLVARAGDKHLLTLLRSVNTERLIFPSPLREPPLPENVPLSAEQDAELQRIAALLARWLRASVLPADQLLLVIAQDVLRKENELAIAHSLSVSLRRYRSARPRASLEDAADLLIEIARNRQRYLSNALIEAGFEPIQGQITVTTMHKAKGLEWDRVYLIGVDELEFPQDPEGSFRGQQWYFGGHDPCAEARKELERLHRGAAPLDSDELVREANLEYIAERLRLLYVGITRAKSELIISYARLRGERPNRLAPALEALRARAQRAIGEQLAVAI